MIATIGSTNTHLLIELQQGRKKKRKKEKDVPFVMTTLRIDSQQLSHRPHSSAGHVSMLDLTSGHFLITRSLYLLTTFIQLPLPHSSTLL